MLSLKDKSIGKIISAVVLLLMIVCSYVFLTESLSDITYRTYFEKDIAEINDTGEVVDLVFVGASRMYQSMIPSAFEEKLGYQNVLVAATATQPMCGTYYYIRELIKEVHPKKIVIDVTQERLLGENSTQACLVVCDRLSGINKFEFVLDCMDKKDYKYLLGPARYKNNIRMIKGLRETKRDIKARNYDVYDPTNSYYADKGFVYSYSAFETGNVPIFDEKEFTPTDEEGVKENIEYLDKCIELCRENEIEVELVTGPCSLSYIYYTDGYDDVVQWYRNYAKEKGLIYHNFGYLKDRETLLPDEMMSDNVHTNGNGASAISNIYADIMLREKNGEDCSDMFYDDFDELSADVHRVLSVRGQFKFDDGMDIQGDTYPATIVLESLANKSDEVYYQVELRQADGDFEVISEWSKNEFRKLQLPCFYDFDLKVRAKNQHEGEKEAFQIYSY